MTLVLSGTNGISAVDGSAASPAIQGSDANTGMFFPAADTVAIATGGTERVRTDSSGNVGIGTSSPRDVAGYVSLGLNATTGGLIDFFAAGTRSATIGGGSSNLTLGTTIATPIVFNVNTNEAARIDSSGRLLINLTSSISSQALLQVQQNCLTGVMAEFNDTDTSSSNNVIRFRKNGTEAGKIAVTTSNTTQYVTSSDYRLKENVQPMTGALALVAALKPCTYTWKSTGEASQGFIAHELAEVCPDAVSGEKDAVNDDGSINPQGIDTSFLVATLTAAIQELKAEVDALKAQLGAQA